MDAIDFLQLLLLSLLVSWGLFWLIALFCFGPRAVMQLLTESCLQTFRSLGRLIGQRP